MAINYFYSYYTIIKIANVYSSSLRRGRENTPKPRDGPQKKFVTVAVQPLDSDESDVRNQAETVLVWLAVLPFESVTVSVTS
jgi:hypothetical protein